MPMKFVRQLANWRVGENTEKEWVNGGRPETGERWWRRRWEASWTACSARCLDRRRRSRPSRTWRWRTTVSRTEWTVDSLHAEDAESRTHWTHASPLPISHYFLVTKWQKRLTCSKWHCHSSGAKRLTAVKGNPHGQGYSSVWRVVIYRISGNGSGLSGIRLFFYYSLPDPSKMLWIWIWICSFVPKLQTKRTGYCTQILYLLTYVLVNRKHHVGGK